MIYTIWFDICRPILQNKEKVMVFIAKEQPREDARLRGDSVIKSQNESQSDVKVMQGNF